MRPKPTYTLSLFTQANLRHRKIFASTGMSRIHAYILPQNTASQRAFENAGFQRSGEEQVKGHGAWHFVRDKATGEL